MQFKVHNEGWVYLVSSIILTIIFIPFFPLLGFILFIFSISIFIFFRDPIRSVPSEDLILSPADGIITFIGETYAPKNSDLKGNFIKISIFLSIFNVHVNRIPVNGTIKKIKYIPGKFLSATLDKSSEENEKNIIVINNKNNESFVVTQIAGLIARRIVNNLKINQKVIKGERFGIIKFGSRVDLYLPNKFKILVTTGQTVVAGETIISNPKNIENIHQSIKI